MACGRIIDSISASPLSFMDFLLSLLYKKKRKENQTQDDQTRKLQLAWP
jgi:hypothetical protein